MIFDRNPYRPGVGLQPPYLAGRESEQDRFTRVLRAAPDIPGNVRLSGLRGVGKTVLLKRFQDLADRENWATINFELQPGQNSESPLTTTLTSQVESLKRRLSLAQRAKTTAGALFDAVRRVATVNYEGFEWSLAGDLEPNTRELGTVLLEGVEAAQNHYRDGLVLLLDEAQILTDDRDTNGAHALSTLVAAVSTLQKSGVAISLVLCGLPTLAVNLLNARTYSERMFQGFVVGSLDPVAARAAFVEPLAEGSISADPELVQQVLTDVNGYPYFIQLWGAEIWEAAREAGLTEMVSEMLLDVRERIYERLDLDFYEPRIASLTPAEQDLLLESRSCSGYPPILVSELNAHSSRSSGNVNVLLGRLVAQNVLYRIRKGQYEYTAPGFREYLLRRSP